MGNIPVKTDYLVQRPWEGNWSGFSDVVLSWIPIYQVRNIYNGFKDYHHSKVV